MAQIHTDVYEAAANLAAFVGIKVPANYEGPNPNDEFADEEAAEADSIESLAYDQLTDLPDEDLVNTAWPNPTGDNADWQALALKVMGRHLRGLIAKHETQRHLMRDDEIELIGLMLEATMHEVRL